MTQHHDHDLEDALHRMAAGVSPPAVPVADDLARGRARRRRQRLTIVGGAAVAVAVVGLGAAVVPQLVSADSPGFSGGDKDPLPGPQTTVPPQPKVREIQPSGDPDAAAIPELERSMEDIRHHPDLNRYRDVLAEYLDPQGEHLERGVSNMQGGGGALGTKLAWTNAGEAGMGMVQVTVSPGWVGLDSWLCGVRFSGQEGWDCQDVPAPRGLTATVAEHDGVTEVAVEHEDGVVAVLAVDTLFGNNSTVPVSGIDLGEDLLVRTAADPRLDLPGYEGGVPPLLDQRTFARVGRQALVAGTEEMETTYTGNDVQPWVQAEWTDGTSRGTLTWEATQAGQTAGYSCLKVQFTQCQVHQVGDEEVFVGYVRTTWGGGWQATYAGPSYDVRVVFAPAASGDDFALDRAFELVTDPRWQPTR
jgi:hypothetical protein